VVSGAGMVLRARTRQGSARTRKMWQARLRMLRQVAALLGIMGRRYRTIWQARLGEQFPVG